MPHSLESLFRPRHIAIVGAGPNDPSRMGTRTLFDLVESGWTGGIWPVSSRHDELYGLPVWRSLRDLPGAPDVVLARTPQAGIEALVDDAIAIGAKFLIVLAAGFAESGEAGLCAQEAMIERARQGGLRILGPQSIGLVHVSEGLPMSLSQIMERLNMRKGSVALLTQSGAMAISLTIRGQQQAGLDYSLIATFGNAADVTPTQALDWLAEDDNTRVIGLYMEGLADVHAFAQAVMRCQEAGKSVVVLRSGMSQRGAAAVASHTASISGDAQAFRALCRQLGVVLCDTAESFLWALKALDACSRFSSPRVAFASISGGACALWADQCDVLGIELPTLDPAQARLMSSQLPSFLSPANPLDLGPAVFDPLAFEAALQGLLQQASINLLVVYMFTSSPSLMGGLEKLHQLEAIANASEKPVWVIWEAATDEEWQALSRSPLLCGFRDIGQAAQALHACKLAVPRLGYQRGLVVNEPRIPVPDDLSTEVAVKEWLRAWGLSVPRGELCGDEAAARRFAAAIGTDIAVKIVSPAVAHKSEVGGVALCGGGAEAVARTRLGVLEAVRLHRPDVQPLGVLVEERIADPGLEMIVTVRQDPTLGLVTVIGKGGVAVEVDRDIVVHVGALAREQVAELLADLRCAPLLGGFRGRPALAVDALAQAVVGLQNAILSSSLTEVELNPVLLTADRAWILDGLASRA